MSNRVSDSSQSSFSIELPSHAFVGGTSQWFKITLVAAGVLFFIGAILSGYYGMGGVNQLVLSLAGGGIILGTFFLTLMDLGETHQPKK